MKRISLDMLFAFDNFIRNGDRGERKPNLLLTRDTAWLIDHEMALDFDEQTIDRISKNQWEDKFGKYHISFPYLVATKGSVKEDYFLHFTNYFVR